MSPRDDSLRLADMLAAAREARHFTAGRVESDLARDRQLTLALLKCVEIIGEARSRDDETVRKPERRPLAELRDRRHNDLGSSQA